MPKRRVRIAPLETGVYRKSKVNFAKAYASFISTIDANSGSAVSFLGTARLESADGKRTISALVMESYAEHANRVLRKICSEVKKKYGLNEIIIVHALGRFKPGEPVVLVALSSPRRRASFDALKEAVERYKKEPALFKQEVYPDGTSRWID
ncbi:MAG TPA: molybdenum cofactor biosynthesis protein MoaE [Nitrososphaerales archaeon]|nr:molybdenum cofactor biosynthesis protein MoaE [Nitrososphaerales archaeon]